MQHGKFSQYIYKNYTNKLIRLLRTAKRNYFTNFLSQHKSNTKAVWTLINKNINKINHFKTCSLNADEINNFLHQHLLMQLNIFKCQNIMKLIVCLLLKLCANLFS